MTRRTWSWGLVGLVLLAAWLRLDGLLHLPLWLDESASWRDASRGLLACVRWEQHRSHPPLSYILVGGVTRAVGTDAAWALRLPSFVMSLVSVALAGVLGRKLYSPGLGLVVALLLAVDPLLVHQGMQARMYSLFVAAMLLSLLAARPLLVAGRGPLSRWLMLGLAMSLAVWSSGLFSVLLIGFALAGPWWWRRRRRETTESASRAVDPAPGDGLGVARGALVCVAVIVITSHVGIVKYADLALTKRSDRGAEETARSVEPTPTAVTRPTATASASVSGPVSPPSGPWSDRARGIVESLGGLVPLPAVGWVVAVIGGTGCIVLTLRGRRDHAVLAGVVVANLVVLVGNTVLRDVVAVRYLVPYAVAMWFGWVGLLHAIEQPVWRRFGVVLLLAVAGLLAVDLDRRQRYVANPAGHALGGKLAYVADVKGPDQSVRLMPASWAGLASYYDLALTPPAEAEPEPTEWLIVALPLRRLEAYGETAHLRRWLEANDREFDKATLAEIDRRVRSEGAAVLRRSGETVWADTPTIEPPGLWPW